MKNIYTKNYKPVIAQRGDVKILFPTISDATEMIGYRNRETVAFWATHELTRRGWKWYFHKEEDRNAL